MAGAFRYTPAFAAAGVYSFTVRANDGNGDGPTATITIPVLPDSRRRLSVPVALNNGVLVP